MTKATKMSWTDDRINLLKKMWKESKSAAEIAKALGKGVTRNAVIGKAHRLGLSGRPAAAAKKAKPAAKAAPAAKKPAARAASAAPKEEAGKAKAGKKTPRIAAAPRKKKAAGPLREPEEPRVFEKEAVPPGGGVALIDLSERMCKWPIGDPREDDFTFCGLPIRAGTPYCPTHAASAYQTTSRRAAVQAKEAEVEDDEDEEDISDDAIEDDGDIEDVE